MSDISNLKDTIIPKSDQLNADQLLSGPMDITVTRVSRGSDDQPVTINYENDQGRPFKPCKSMRKVLIFAWGEDGREWTGKSIRLFNDPSVKWGGVMVGGIRISHLSHIDGKIQISLSATKSKKETHIIDVLRVAPAQKSAPVVVDVQSARQTMLDACDQGTDALSAAWSAIGKDARAELGADFINKLKEIAATI